MSDHLYKIIGKLHVEKLHIEQSRDIHRRRLDKVVQLAIVGGVPSGVVAATGVYEAATGRAFMPRRSKVAI